MPPLHPVTMAKKRADLSSDSPLTSLASSHSSRKGDASNLSTPLSSPPPSPGPPPPPVRAVPTSLGKRRAVISSDDDDDDVSSLVVLEPSPAKRAAVGNGGKPVVATPKSSYVPDSDTLVMGSSSQATKLLSTHSGLTSTNGSQPVKPKKDDDLDDLDDLDDFDWGDDDAAAVPSSSGYPALATSPLVAPVSVPTIAEPRTVDSSPSAARAHSLATPSKLKLNTPSKPSPLSHTSAGDVTQSPSNPPPSPTSAILNRIALHAKERAARVSALTATLSGESDLSIGSKGKRKAMDEDELDLDTDADLDFPPVSKRGRKPAALSDSGEDSLPSLAALKSSKAPPPKRSAKSPAPVVYHDAIGSRLRQKVTTSSSSSAPSYVTRGQDASLRRPAAMTAKRRAAAAATAAPGPNNSASNKLMLNLLKKSGKRSDMLSRAGRIRIGGQGEELSESDDSDDELLSSAADRQRSPSKGGPSSAVVSTLGSSDDSVTESDGDGAPVDDDLDKLGTMTEGISAVLAKDRLAKATRRAARRELRKKTWAGCWVRPKKKKVAEGNITEEIQFVQEPWDVIRIQGESEHPLFRLLLEAADQEDMTRFTAYLALGALSPAVVATVDGKGELVTALFESACLSSSDQLSTLCLSHLLAILRASTADAPVLSPKDLFLRLTGAFRGMGYRHSLIEDVNRAGDGTPRKPKAKPRGQGEVYDLPFKQRCKAVASLSAVVETVATHHLLNESRLVKMICILVLLSLDKTTPVELKMTLERTIATAISSLSSMDSEIKLCYKLNDLSKDKDMNFKLGIVNALPRMGLKEGRLARALGIIFLGGVVDEDAFEYPPDLVAVAQLVSLEDRHSKFLVATETDYAQMIAAIRVLAVVVGDTETLYQLDPTAPDVSKEVRDQVAEGVKCLVANLAKCEHKIMDARASNLDRSAAKAFLLNLHVSLGYKTAMFQRLHQPKLAAGELGKKGQTTLSFKPVGK